MIADMAAGMISMKLGAKGPNYATVSACASASHAIGEAARKIQYGEADIMITGGSSSGVAIAVQGLCQEAGVIFMAGLTHSNDTTGKDKRANGFRHFFNTEMSGAALGPVLRTTSVLIVWPVI